MTSRITEIQTLIAEIDSLLSNRGLSRFLSSQGQQPRQVLERIRNFLVRCAETEEQEDSTENRQQSQLSSLLARFTLQNHHPSLSQQNQLYQDGDTPEASPFSALLAPLQAELHALLQERANLVQEIRQLEQRRLQNYSLAQQLANQEQIIADFLQMLTNRLGGNPQSQISTKLANPPQEQLLTLGTSNSSIASNTTPSLSEPQEQLERLTHFANELDRRLLALDGSVNVVFESLQRNIHTYHESLSEALARMYSQSLQGEQLLTGFINNLTQEPQPQITSTEPFTIDIHRETLPPELNNLQPGDTTNSLETELLESASAESSAALTNNLQENDSQIREDTSTTSEIEPLNQDKQNTPDTAADVQDSSVSIRDEVDQLYASLFGVDNGLAANPEVTPQQANTDDATTQTNQEELEFFPREIIFEVPEVTNESSVDATTQTNQEELEFFPREIVFEIPEVTDESSVDATTQTNPEELELFSQEIIFEVPDATDELSVIDTAQTNQEELEFFPPEKIFEAPNVTDELPAGDTPPAPTTNEIQPANPAVAASDPWFDEPDAGLLEQGNANALDTQNASEIIRQQLLDLSSKITFTENAETSSYPTQEKSSGDTIASLPELVIEIDVANNEQSPEVETPENSAPAPQTDDAEIENSNLNESFDNYIPASPEENLLLQEQSENIAVPQISLNEEHLQQLDRDLAEFAQQANSQQVAANLESQELAEGKINTSSSSAQLGETEKKEVTTDYPEISLPSDSSFVGDTEAGFNPQDCVWYLGIDLGTTGISAVLLNRSTTQVYPLYWSAENQKEATPKTQAFRLPAEVYLPSAVSSGQNLETESKSAAQNLFSAHLKPYLQIALPYRSEWQTWEPVLQFNEVSTVPLVWVVRSLSKLLLTLKSDRSSTTLGLIGAAVGLKQSMFRNAIDNLAGVICSCPSNWSEQYRFNVREALLISKIVQHPQQVFFVEEAIASLLCELDGANGEIVKLTPSQAVHPAKTSEHPLVGNTLVINVGASVTEMALVDLPENLEDLTHSDFMLHGFAYAGKGIEQDIICQLLLPTKWRQPRNQNQKDNNATINSNPWQWQPAVSSVEQMSFSDLGLEGLNLPRPGEPDISDRICLQQRLESSLLGKAVVDAAVALKLILQHQESFTLELADQSWNLQRRYLESQVFVPFVRRLNRELNKLLVAKGTPTEGINQVILTGGTTSIGAVSRWLRQKLPNAKMIQDSYLGENGTPSCSRVAYGLAMLPLHPQVLDVPRQQYTDYFLFTELLRLIPERALSLNEVIELFETRGINTRSCQQRLLAFLEGEIPPGLVPNRVDHAWLAQISRENSDYQAIADAPLFEKQGSLTYRPNSTQLQTLRRYLDTIKASTQQSLQEPYTVNFAIGVAY